MKYTIENLESTINDTKKSFLFFGEYLTQNKKKLDKNEYSLGTDLMKLLLININSYGVVLKESHKLGSVSETHYDFIEESMERLVAINKTIQEQYGDIEFI